MRVNRHDAPSSRWSASTLRRSMLYRRPFLTAILISCPEALRSSALETGSKQVNHENLRSLYVISVYVRGFPSSSRVLQCCRCSPALHCALQERLSGLAGTQLQRPDCRSTADVAILLYTAKLCLS